MIKSILNGSIFQRFNDFVIFITLTLIPTAIGLAHIWDYCSRGNWTMYDKYDVKYAILVSPITETFLYFVPIVGLMYLMRFNFWVIGICFCKKLHQEQIRILS